MLARGPLGRAQDLIVVLDELVRRQAALRLAEIHGAARGDEAHPELLGGRDLRVQELDAAGGEDVVVVEDRRAARQGKLGQPRPGRGVLGRVVDARPERIELAQPGEEVGLLGARAREGLEEVVVRVDQTGGDERAAEVLEVLGGRRRPGPDRLDEAVVQEDPAVGVLRPVVVHRHDVGVRRRAFARRAVFPIVGPCGEQAKDAGRPGVWK